jgi:DNA polymerase
LFIGEAPGPSEDLIGQPFVGPAGKLLDRLIEIGLDGQVDYCMTNLVCCIPIEEGSKKFDEPPKESIFACKQRLTEFIQLVKPKAIVCVGKLAKKYAPSISSVDYYEIIHPAAILRMDASQQPLAGKRCIATLEEVIARLN